MSVGFQYINLLSLHYSILTEIKTKTQELKNTLDCMCSLGNESILRGLVTHVTGTCLALQGRNPK